MCVTALFSTYDVNVPYHVMVPIAHKLAVLLYQSIHGLAPAYLADALQPVAQIPGRQRLRSSLTSALAVPLTRL